MPVLIIAFAHLVPGGWVFLLSVVGVGIWVRRRRRIARETASELPHPLRPEPELEPYFGGEPAGDELEAIDVLLGWPPSPKTIDLVRVPNTSPGAHGTYRSRPG